MQVLRPREEVQGIPFHRYWLNLILKTKVLISCRSNFYKSETEDSSASGTIKGFNSYLLLSLSNSEIHKFIQSSLGNKQEDFIEELHKKNLTDICANPFYLTKLVEIYELSNSLPTGKADLFYTIIDKRFTFNIKHYRLTIELEEKKRAISQWINAI